MQIILLGALLAYAAHVSALPAGPLYAKRLAPVYDERLRSIARQASEQRPLSISSNSYPYTSDVLNYEDPVSNTTALHSPPIYRALTPFDYSSFNLALYQEWIELDLFHNGLARFSAQDFADAGIGPEYTSIINFMANQEVAHATLLGNILGPGHAEQCTYSYPFTTVRGFLDFCQRLTRWGESGVYGFLSQLNSADSATLLTNSIVTEARQQMIFRQLLGAFPMPVAFVPGIPQSWAWTLLNPYITSCPTGTPPIRFSAYPGLNVTRQSDGSVPTILNTTSVAAVSTNETSPVISPGEALVLKWASPGAKTGPDGAYKTVINSTGQAKYAGFVTHVNTTFAPLHNISGNSAVVYVPDYAPVFSDVPDIGVLNGTAFVIVTDADTYVTPYNLTMINKHIVAGPQMIQFG